MCQMRERVDTRSLHAVKLWIRQRIKSGQLKNCGHLSSVLPLEIPGQGNNRVPTPIYVPQCSQDSFEWKQPRLDRKDEWDILRYQLHNDPIECPENCCNYEHRYWTRTKERASRALSALGHGFKWFASLPWPTQVLIILLLILALAPSWVPQIIELLKLIIR